VASHLEERPRLPAERVFNAAISRAASARLIEARKLAEGR